MNAGIGNADSSPTLGFGKEFKRHEGDDQDQQTGEDRDRVVMLANGSGDSAGSVH